MKVGDFGRNGLVLGLNKNGQLQNFKQLGGKGYGKFFSSSRNFAGQIKDAMTQANKIRFNLTGVDVSKTSGALSAYGEPLYGYTNYELFLIKSNPTILNKTVFYLNGSIVPSPF